MTATVKSRYMTIFKQITAFICGLLCMVAVCCFFGTNADAAAVSSCTVSGITAKTYTGSAVKQNPTVKYKNKVLRNGIDYTVSYQNNKNAGTAYVIIKGKGSYSGTIKKSFKIQPAVIYNRCSFYKVATQYYTGSQLKPVPLIKNGSTVLKNGVDFTLTYEKNVNKGTATVNIKGKGNYKGSCYLNFKIVARPVSMLNISVPAATYTGKALKPAVTVKYGNKTYKNGTDYTLTYKNNTKVGTATVVVTGKGKLLTGSKSVTFKINPKPISKATIAYKTSLTYNGTALSPAVTVKYGKATLKKNTDYTVSYSNNKNAGTATITVKGKGIYGGSVKKTFRITRKAIPASAVSNISAKSFTGAAIKPVPVVKIGSKTLKNGTDFTLSYKNNTALGTATVVLTGKGNYSGTVTKTFKITERAVSGVKITAAGASYTGAQVKPAVTVSYGTYKFKNGTDYTLFYKNNTEVGTASVTVTGKNHLSGSKTVTFKISKADIRKANTVIGNAIFTGQEVKPALTVKTGSLRLIEGTDYTVSYLNNINAGNAQLTLTGKGKFEGAITKAFIISKADIADAQFNVKGVYSPAGTIFTVSGKYGEYELKTGDSEVTDTDLLPGEHKVAVNGAGNFTGSVTTDCVVEKADISAAKVTLSLSTSGKGYTVTVKYDGILLAQDTDYKVDIDESAGNVSAVVTGAGNYNGTLKITEISGALELFENATVSVDDVTYSGGAQLPATTVAIGSSTLKAGTDYILSAYNNINAGTATAVITGIGSFEGAEIKASFKVLPAAISSARITCADQQYTSNTLTPVPTVTYNGKTLAKDTDYTVSGYKNNVNAGTASFTVTGKGNFTGTVTGKFRIVKKNSMEALVQKRLDEMMEGKWDRKINDFWHSYQLGKYYNTLLTSPCTCHSFCETGNETGCTCLIGRSNVLGNQGIQCAGFTIEVFEYLFGKTNGYKENTLTIKNRSDGNWTEAALKKWMTDTFRPGDYLAYDNIMYGYPHYVTIYSVDTDGIWVYEANYGGRCKINFRKFTFKEIYEQTDGLWHRTPDNYELSEY